MCCLALGLSGAPALGQTPLGAADARLELVDQPIWYEPGDDLDITVEVFNESSAPLDGFRLIVGVDDLVRTRSELNLFFDGVPRFEPSRIPLDFDIEIPPGGSSVVELEEPLTAIPTLAVAGEAGVYPASLTLQDAAGVADLDALSTPFIFYPEEPETPLGLVLVVPLNAPPAAEPTGVYAPSSDETDLPELLTPGRGLRAVLDAMSEATEREEARSSRGRSARRGQEQPPEPLHAAIAATPRLVAEIHGMTEGYRTDGGTVDADTTVPQLATEFIRLLKELSATRPQVQPLLVPYSFPDLPTLTASPLRIEHLAQQISAGRDVMQMTLDTDLDGEWLFPPGGRIDAETLEQLQLLGFGSHTLFSFPSLDPLPEPSGCPELSPTFTCPVEVEVSEGSSTGFVSDPGLVERANALQADPLDRVAVQKLFAETAMVHVELPGTSGRSIQVTIPSLWNPTAAMARRVLIGFRDAPWLTSQTPSEGLAKGFEPINRAIEVEAEPPDGAPQDSFFEELLAADAVVDSYSSILPAGNERIARLRRNVLVAESRNLWGDHDRAAEFFRASKTEAEEAMSNISINVAEDFTLTSREGQIQLRVTNGTEDPVRLDLVLISEGLSFQENQITEVFEPGSRLLELKTEARGSGVFRLLTRVQTPEGGYLIDEKETVIRSTSFNQIALAITIGALAFLVLFYIGRALRRRRLKEPVEA